jgi:hypothetical protein
MVASRADSFQQYDAIEAAIARVLAAERAARDAVGRARNDGAAMTDAARAAARVLNERTERRIRTLHAAFDRKVGAALAAFELEATRLTMHQELSAGERARVERAVANLAAELTGDSR